MINQIAACLSRPKARVALVLKDDAQRAEVWGRLSKHLEAAKFFVGQQYRVRGLADQQMFLYTEAEVVARAPAGLNLTNVLYDWRVGSEPIEWLRTLVRSPEFDNSHMSVESLEG